MAQMYGEAVRCEAVRDEVFDGQEIADDLRRARAVAGAAHRVAAARRAAANTSDREQLRARAFDEAPAIRRRHRWTAVRVDRRRRLAAGPGARSGHQRPLLLGAVRPADARSSSKPPEDLRDVVWMPAHLQFENGGESVALIPTRYPGSASGRGRPDRAGAEDRLGGNRAGHVIAASVSASSRPTPATCRSWRSARSRSPAARRRRRELADDHG